AASSTIRFRIGDNGESASKAAQSGNFVIYLPQDEAVAVGYGPEEGGLDPVESQRVVDLLNKELSRLLKLNPRDFWKEVATDESLPVFLESFTRYRSRWYDFPHRGGRGKVAGVVLGEVELCRRIFMLFYRLSSNQDPGAKASETLNSKDHGVLLQNLKLLDLPKLLDICAVYGHENEDLARKLVMNAMKAQQPHIHDEFPVVLSHFLTIAQTMNERCSSRLEVPFLGGPQRDQGSCHRLHHDFLEVMDFINDSVVSFDSFINAYNPAAIFFSSPVETSYGKQELLTTLALLLHDTLLPSLQKGFDMVREAVEEEEGKGCVVNFFASLKLLSTRLIQLGWRLIHLCYLSDVAFDDEGSDYSSSLSISTKIFPANVDDPSVRTDILIQMMRTLSGNPPESTFIRAIEAHHGIMGRINLLTESGWLAMDREQCRYLSFVATGKEQASSTVDAPSTARMVDEDAAIAESKISQIKELFPNYGRGFLSACLEVYNQDAEEVIQRILEGSLHKELVESLDISSEQLPSSSSATTKATTTTFSKQDKKGKGKMEDSIVEIRSSGRFIRKDAGEPSGFEAMNDRELAKTAALITQMEYEDEYDDSFDELGLGVGDDDPGGLLRPRDEEAAAAAPASSNSWNSRTKPPQFYVKDGKNYSYRVEGSVAASDFEEARLINQAQKELIHGLGRGGNLPLGAVKRLTEEQQQQQQPPTDHPPDSNRGRGRGRGRGRRGGSGHPSNNTEEDQQENSEERRGGGSRRGRGRNNNNNNYRRDRAMRKHLSGV
ncbi:hypothetical protein M569_13307, partial [Genlisea aurea]